MVIKLVLFNIHGLILIIEPTFIKRSFQRDKRARNQRQLRLNSISFDGLKRKLIVSKKCVLLG